MANMEEITIRRLNSSAFCKDLRSKGWSYGKIAKRIGRSRERAAQLCKLQHLFTYEGMENVVLHYAKSLIEQDK